MDNEKFSFYKKHPKTCQPDDFWGQVKRTVNGKPVSQDQIDMIVTAVLEQLELKEDDFLLDLCCGNGALTSLLLEHSNGGLGVDFSEYLIKVANEHFSDPPNHSYILSDVIEFCENPLIPEKFTKMVCYGSFSYLETHRAERLLSLLADKFPNVKKAFIGNCPDKVKMPEFFGDRVIKPGIEDEADSPIGIWRTEAEFIKLANRCGWNAKSHQMPQAYYASHYRYDIVLSR
jgi:SAM-dependent methyltransferase